MSPVYVRLTLEEYVGLVHLCKQGRIIVLLPVKR